MNFGIHSFNLASQQSALYVRCTIQWFEDADHVVTVQFTRIMNIIITSSAVMVRS